MKKKLSLFGVVILVLAVTIFSVLNMQSVAVNFFSLKVRMPLVLLIICSVSVGIVITSLFSTVASFKHKRKIKTLNNEVASLKKQVQEKVEDKKVIEDKKEE